MKGYSKRGELSVVLRLHRKSSGIVPVEGPLREPVNPAVRDNVRALLRGVNG